MTSLRLKNYLFFIAFLILLFFCSDLSAGTPAPKHNASHEHQGTLFNDMQSQIYPKNLHPADYTFSTYNKFYNHDIKGLNFTSHYVKTLTKHLLDKSIDFEKISNTSLVHEDNNIGIRTTAQSTIDDDKEVVLINALWYAGVEVTRASPLYQRLQYYENELHKYVFMEYSKSIADNQPGLYLPGEITEAKRKEKKEYKISLSTFAAPDEDTARLDMSLNVSTLFYNINSRLSYSIIDEHTTFATSNTRINEYLGADLKLIIGEIFETEKVYLASIEFTY